MASGWDKDGNYRIEINGRWDHGGTGGNSGNHNETLPGGTTDYPNTLGFPPVNNGDWFKKVPKWDVISLGEGKTTKGINTNVYITRIENYVYKIYIDTTGRVLQVDYVNWEKDLENRAPDYQQQTPFRAREEQAKNLAVDVNNVIGKAADFYKEITAKFSDSLSKQAQSLAETAKGKKLKNAGDALRAFNKYKNEIDTKFSAADRAAISQALESVNRAELSKTLAQYSKVFGIVSYSVNGLGLYDSYRNAVRTGQWGGFYTDVEKLLAGMVASELVAFAFGVMATTTMGILGFGLIMIVMAALVDKLDYDSFNKSVLGLI
ncbi:colicin-like pore-forming protein [Lelliottia nimipressuralis]|uniref:colicin-like pore-forming protein n=1 Tax=Lelliottia nimipressuralis TaxID=69220 RepID=UPI00141B595C|nr:colicin-like pore-forming protein [Lelliottia nimipressuralis]